VQGQCVLTHVALYATEQVGTAVYYLPGLTAPVAQGSCPGSSYSTLFIQLHCQWFLIHPDQQERHRKLWTPKDSPPPSCRALAFCTGPTCTLKLNLRRPGAILTSPLRCFHLSNFLLPVKIWGRGTLPGDAIGFLASKRNKRFPTSLVWHICQRGPGQ
jgi:hypothetical protein